jgi:hypothetical protein
MLPPPCIPERLMMQHQSSTPNRRPAWFELGNRFADERECLASFLALETAEILEGVKPANLINIADRRRACGRNLHSLWRRYGAALLRRSGLRVREMAQRDDAVLLFIYHEASLVELLSRKNVATFLGKAGYGNTADLETTLAQLQGRMDGDGFPHEIGVFLGYPLKDVAGFMGLAPLPVTGQGLWKIFGPPEKSLQLAETFLDCRCRMARRLARCATPVECLKVVGSQPQGVF